MLYSAVASRMRAEIKPTQRPVSEEGSPDKAKVTVEGDAAKDVDLLTLEDIRDQIRYIEKAVATKELHFMTRVLRGIVLIRRKLNSNVLRGLVHTYFAPQSQQWNYFMEFLPEVIVLSRLLIISCRRWTLRPNSI